MNSFAMSTYEPNETKNYNQTHTVLYSFQYEDAHAQIISEMEGNVSGGAVMMTEFDTGITVPAEHELTQKHVVFYDDEDAHLPYREVKQVILHYPDGRTHYIETDILGEYLVGIQIINYQP